MKKAGKQWEVGTPRTARFSIQTKPKKSHLILFHVSFCVLSYGIADCIENVFFPYEAFMAQDIGEEMVQYQE